MNNKFQLKISNNEVTNVNDIIIAIKEETNIEILKAYFNFLKERISPAQYKGVDIILDELNNLITIIDKVQNTYYDENNIMLYLKEYTANYQLNEEQLLQVYSFISNEIALYESGIKEYQEDSNGNDIDIEQKRLDYIMFYISTKDKNQIESNLESRYKKISIKAFDFGGKSNGYSKKLLNPSTPISIDSDAFANTITIISITLLMGLFIATILLVK